jgi:hypothetical protein
MFVGGTTVTGFHFLPLGEDKRLMILFALFSL